MKWGGGVERKGLPAPLARPLDVGEECARWLLTYWLLVVAGIAMAVIEEVKG